MTDSLYCNMIHGGLWLDFTVDKGLVEYSYCCLASKQFQTQSMDWNDANLSSVRSTNLTGKWHPACSQCKNLEQANGRSFRQWYNDAYGIDKQYPGPIRIDVKLSNACNLACRSCGPHSSTFWAKHLRDHNVSNNIIADDPNWDYIRKTMDRLDLSVLDQVVFCGGETLLGNSLFRFLDYILQRRPDGNMTISFQTNGTQSVPTKYQELMSRFKLIKFNISIDGTHDKFEYLRWPASWQQLTENMLSLRETVPVNVMFLVEQTVSVFNLLHKHDVPTWIRDNFAANRLGDAVDYREHFAFGIFSLEHLSQKYVDALQADRELLNFIPQDLVVDTDKISKMVAVIKQFDSIRGQDWAKTFPEIYGFYH